MSGLVSGGPLSRRGERALMTARLAAAQLPIPDTLICAEDVCRRQAEPGRLLEGPRPALGFDASQCVVVEDAPAGYRRGAGRLVQKSWRSRPPTLPTKWPAPI